MKKELTYGISGLVIGAALSGAIVLGITNKDEKPANTNNSAAMQDMTSTLKDKMGDDFDKAFISGMIDHHQDAIDMSELAKQNAKHDEIKNLANDIISAQSKEIAMMKSWQTQWGYNPQNNSNMEDMSH